MSEVDIKKLVYSFCEALTLKNIDNIERILTEQATLSWGPYKFVGKKNVLNWAKELWELFPFMAFKEKSLEIHESGAKHEFMIAFITPEGRKGWLPCIGVYKFMDGQVIQLDISLLHGFVAVDRDDIERVKPHPSRQK